MRPDPIRSGGGAAAALALAMAAPACAPAVEAPTARGVCWHMVAQAKGKPNFFVVSRGEPDLEHCAAALEGMRLHFLALGGSVQEVDGAYQGQFLFDDPRGVFTAAELNAQPFPFLVRSGGRLAPPGAPSNPDPSP